MKLWAGRFQKETDDKVNDFNSSISFDARLYRQDIAGSIAHATMLGEQGIIAKEEADKIVATLKILLEEIEAGKVDAHLREVRKHELEELREVHLALAGYALDGLCGRVDELLRELRGVPECLRDQCGKALDINGHELPPLFDAGVTRYDPGDLRLPATRQKTCGFMCVCAGAISRRHRRAVAGYS